MAVMNLESLVLRGVRVACDVETGLKRIGSNTANGQTPAADLSPSRHPSHGAPGYGRDTGPRYGLAEKFGAGAAAERAGRPGCRSGVFVRRSPAMPVGPAVLSGWPLAGEVFAITRWRTGALTTGRRQVGRRLPQRFHQHSARTQGRMPAEAQTGSGGEAQAAATRGCRIFDS
jgi:hypothetical protein